MNKNNDRHERRLQRAHRIRRIRSHLEEKGRFQKQKHFVHHGNTSVYTHVMNVAWWAHTLADHLPVKTDLDSVVRSALLHDYFLYDWHDDHGHSPHGFTHPDTALQNAKEDFDLNHREEDAIRKHMWPLTVIPPKYTEGWLITMADKIATWEETLGKRKARKLKKRSNRAV